MDGTGVARSVFRQDAVGAVANGRSACLRRRTRRRKPLMMRFSLGLVSYARDNRGSSSSSTVRSHAHCGTVMPRAARRSKNARSSAVGWATSDRLGVIIVLPVPLVGQIVTNAFGAQYLCPRPV